MKFAYIALLGMASAIQLRYDEAEGPTKADNGELDETVLQHQTLGNQDGFKEWENPLAKLDDGSGDDTVVLQMSDNSMVMVKNEVIVDWKKWTGVRKIFDADGDGIEDNIEKTREELDRHYMPAVFGIVEDLYNTHHGFLPGHVRAMEEEKEPSFYDPYGYASTGGFADMKLRI